MFYNDYDIQLLMGDNYTVLKELDNAIGAYVRASQMCPNRFTPLYNIFRIYVSQRDYENANKVATELVNKPVKVDSYDVIKIKAEVRRFLD